MLSIAMDELLLALALAGPGATAVAPEMATNGTEALADGAGGASCVLSTGNGTDVDAAATTENRLPTSGVGTEADALAGAT